MKGVMRTVMHLPSVFMFISGMLYGQQSMENRPNIILIVADDLGYSDIGCYGSEINTPNLDRLGANGMRFRSFYNMAKCNPTRSTMLTGQYRLDDRKTTKDSDHHMVPLAELMRRAGYITLACGKDHFDPWVPPQYFARNSFDKFFGYWAIAEYFIPPSGRFENPFVLNGTTLKPEKIPSIRKPFFKTDAVTDMALQWMDESLTEGKPFFLYLAYNAPHYPLQARDEDIARYRGRYVQGWDKIREQRFAKMKHLGIMPSDAGMSPPGGNNVARIPIYPGSKSVRDESPAIQTRRKKVALYRPWEQLTDSERDEMDLEMAVYAAMIDRLDQNIGRVLQKLESTGAMEHTVILFLSDNGACPYDSNRDFDHPPGGADSYRSLCAAWANAANTPFRYFKWAGHEGGCNTPFIAHWPKAIPGGIITSQPGHVVDVIPTFLDIAGAQYPTVYNGQATMPLHGQSLFPVFRGEQRKQPEFFISGLGEGFAMFRQKNWKIARWNDTRRWELFDLSTDPTEIHNLADRMPEKVIELEQRYESAKKKLRTE